MENTVKIVNESGMHARPAGVFVKVASSFTSDVQLKVGEKVVNAKSIMNLMTLGLALDDEITIIANGDDAEGAVKALTDLVNNKFEA